jgi:hypothetical protein
MSVLSTTVHKRARRTKGEMARIRDAMVRLARENQPVTCRQLFYLLVSAGAIAKTEGEYSRTVIRLALELRRSGAIDWSWIVDQTRWCFRPKSFDTLRDALEETARVYRRSLWAESDVQVKVWCESLSVAGIIKPETLAWDVPLFPGKGYSSHAFLRSAARDIAYDGRPAIVYLFGDYDASGRDIIAFVRRTLHEYASEVDPDVTIDFDIAAVTEQQIVDWALPGHPAKRLDPRRSRYGIDHAVELEAIAPDRLRALVRECIAQHIDPDALARLRSVEAAERETLRSLAEARGGWTPWAP